MKANAATAAPKVLRRPAKRYAIDDQVGFLLRLANQRHTAIFQTRINCDLTPTQWSVVAKLNQVGAASQNHLGRLTRLDAATIKGVIDRLIEKGLVTRRVDAIHARRHVLALTKQGRLLVQKHAHDALKISAETLAPLSTAEQAKFLRSLAKLT